jgi:MFS family permease
MYQIADAQSLLGAGRRVRSRRTGNARVSKNVWLLGLTSLFTDISSEMVATILPLYLVYTRGLSLLQFGVVDGLYLGGAALVRIASGFVGDRGQRHKQVAVFGYALSAVCKLAFIAVGSVWAAFSAIVLADRTGKGIRTAPRDALISLSSSRQDLATSFGVHRALDTTGAMIGPLLAFALLALTPLHFTSVFVVSFCIAIVGLAILMLFVENRTAEESEGDRPAVSVRAVAGLLATPRLRVLVAIAGILGLVTISDGFLYLALQRHVHLDPRFFPLLYVGTAVSYALLAVPLGRVADRFGRGKVFVGGYALLLVVYTSVLLPTIGVAGLLIYLLLFGAYYAATDGVLPALASSVLPADLRGSGLALLGTATNLSRLFSSILFGALWTAFGVETATLGFGAALLLAGALSAAGLVRTKEPEPAYA